MQELTLLQKSLEQYAQVEKELQNTPDALCRLYLKWANAWTLMGKRSGEVTDVLQALAKFQKGVELGCSESPFRVGYADAIILYCHLSGDPQLLEEAFSLLRSVIADTYGDDNPESQQAWCLYARAMELRYKLTHDIAAFEEANKTYREAILHNLDKPELWLDWGELLVQAGWFRNDHQMLEMALEKLTSSKISACDPRDAMALMGEGLALLGLELDDFRLISEGKRRVLETLDEAPTHPKLLLAAGIALVCEGIYHASAEAFTKAIFYLERVLEHDATCAFAWKALYKTYLAWGMVFKDVFLIERAVQAVSRLVKICPFSPLYLNEWGVALMHLRHIEKDPAQQEAHLEEAIEAFKKAWNLKEDLETLYNWGCALDLLGDLTGHEEDYEKSVELLGRVYEEVPEELQVRYHLALALTHYGEVTAHVPSLYQAIELLVSIVQHEPEDETLLCELGYTQLVLAELVYDPTHPKKGEDLRRESERYLLKAAKIGHGDAYYHLACLYSLTHLHEAAMRFLRLAETHGTLPPIDELEEDAWLTSLRETDAFQEFLRTRKSDG